MVNPIEDLRQLQRFNRQARWMYLGGAGVTALFALVFWTWFPLLVTAFFVGLTLWNERLIWSIQRALDDWDSPWVSAATRRTIEDEPW